MGQLDDSLISQHLADHQILEAVALVDAAVDGDPVGLDFEQAGIGKGGGAPLEPDDEIDLTILGHERPGNTVRRTPDSALMATGALSAHDLLKIAPGVPTPSSQLGTVPRSISPQAQGQKGQQ